MTTYRFFRTLSVCLFIFSLAGCGGDAGNVAADPKGEDQIYTPDHESLVKHEAAPEWFQDAKLGIYFHWGVYTVPAFDSEWYPYWMHQKGSPVHKHHLEKYGDITEFGYHDFVPMFTAEKFDAEKWADMFAYAGAKFSGPVAQHHDGFAMWDSEVNPWNSMDKGPKRDITGEMATALRKRDIKLITTFHHARNLQRNQDDKDNYDTFDSHFAWDENWPTATEDPELRKLYGNIPADEFHEYWLAQLEEVIEKYNPDIVWFDSWLNVIPWEYRNKFMAYYLNHARERDQEVVMVYKQSDLPRDAAVQDIEQGGREDVTDRPWMTDVTLSNQSWCYVEGQTYKTADLVVRNMIDVVSKNGVVLLNVSPRADGSIPEAQQEVLRDIGDWMKDHGEAFFGTRPWDLYGFGTATAEAGHFGGQSATVAYTADDVRFTQSKDHKTLYLHFLGKPEAGRKSLALMSAHRYTPHTPIKKITVLGSGENVPFEMLDHDFFVDIPAKGLNEIATVLKFELE